MRTRYSTIAALVATATIFASDFQIPSLHPPRGMAAEKAPVFVLLGFDDNAYTGQEGSIYYPSGSWENNAASSTAAGWASKWVTDKLVGGTRAKNPDGTPVHVSFYSITGQTGTLNKFGAKGVIWGRELKLIPDEYKRLKAAGHEVTNHTIDHLECNVYSKHDNTQDKNCVGMSMDTKEYFTIGGKSYFGESKIYPGSKGWIDYAGQSFTREAWKDVLTRAHDFMKETIQIEGKGFRAPRLEFNGGLFGALKDIKYDYDITLEEGMQNNLNSQTMHWPYTTDHGLPGLWVSMDMTDDAKNDPVRANSKEFPEGLWEIPTHVLLVPENMRQAIATRVTKTEKDFQEKDVVDQFLKDGKISGLDFNLYVDWLVTGEEWLKIMKFNLEERLKGNHAPLVYGCHSAYYHPAYDFETLAMDKKYKVVLKYNKFEDRAKYFEQFVDECLKNKAVRVVSGEEFIKWSRDPKDLDGKSYGPEKSSQLEIDAVKVLGAAGWAEESDELESGAKPSVNGGTLSVNFDVKMPIVDEKDDSKSKWPAPSCVANVDGSNFSKFEGLSFDYSTPRWVRVGVRCEIEKDKFADYTFQVNHLSSTSRNSGFIPVRDLELDQWLDTKEIPAPAEVPLDKIVSIIVQPNVPSQFEEEKFTTTISNFKLYGAELVPSGVAELENVASKSLEMKQLTSEGVLFVAPVSGAYEVSVYRMNGQLVSTSTQSFAAGSAAMSFTSKLAPAAYLVQINGANSVKLTTKGIVN